ncbi:MAG TPA: glycine betaine ABC transporter substrate-binding protein [Ignavibacteriaceae bacterium]|nr:glycine betaine ABC transporter substrate-binding protein [Ignavibacteriaceae bacterium]
MIKFIKIIACLLLMPSAALSQEKDLAHGIKVGSKKFTEGVILGEIITQLARISYKSTEHLKELGGTRILWNALRKGDIDIYPEYTGTIREEIFAGKIKTDAEARKKLHELGIEMSRPLGFNNTYALGMKQSIAGKLGIKKISDLQKHKELKFGLSNEFMDRKDGWPGLRDRYKLSGENVTGLDHDLSYRGLENGSIDVVDLYSTDAEIKYYNLKILEDDFNYFPEYKAVILYRSNLKKNAPEVLNSVLRLESNIPESSMVSMNAKVKLDLIPEGAVAAEFIQKKFGLRTEFVKDNFFTRLLAYSREHIYLVSVSLFWAVIFSVPIGILAYKKKKFSVFILGLTGIIQTIPSLALLVFMIPLLGIGSWPAIAALFLYSLLPIVRNTYSGLQNIPLHIRESAEVLGLSWFYKLWLIELPLALPSILAGIKTSAVINVGTATLGALIGAGGYGQPILTGIRLDNMSLILEGAVPAALLALTVQLIFDLLEKIIVPRGLRL